jgi:hypothetical protein
VVRSANLDLDDSIGSILDGNLRWLDDSVYVVGSKSANDEHCHNRGHK